MSRASQRDRRIAYSQNFLCRPRLIDQLVREVGITGDDLVIEIGPGRGAITDRLAAHCRQVLAVERDPVLAERLRGRFAGAANVALFAGDFLHFPLPLSSYKVFANIPFNVTTAIVAKLTSGVSPPAEAFLVVQREAAERFLGTPRETLISVLLKPWFAPSVAHHFARTDFVPRPGVDAVLLRLHRRVEPLVASADDELFADVVTFAFTAWKPTVGDALAGIMPHRVVAAIEREAGVPVDRPPGDIPCTEWIRLASAVGAVSGERVVALHGARARLARQQTNLAKRHRTDVSHAKSSRPSR